jgi:hypothetical protein
MSGIRRVATVFVLLALGLLITSAHAGSIEIELKPASPEVKARGTVFIKHDSYIPYERFLDMYVSRLEPNSVYSVWIREKDNGTRNPAGLRDENHFRTDGAGNAHYTAMLSEYDLDWNTLEITYHPDGDPGNTKDMSVVLFARLYL